MKKVRGLKAGGWWAGAGAAWKEEGLPRNCRGLWEAGSHPDGVPEGGERPTTTDSPPADEDIDLP